MSLMFVKLKCTEQRASDEQPLEGAVGTWTCNAAGVFRAGWLTLLAPTPRLGERRLGDWRLGDRPLRCECRRCCRRIGSNDVNSDVTSSSVRPPDKHDSDPASAVNSTATRWTSACVRCQADTNHVLHLSPVHDML